MQDVQFASITGCEAVGFKVGAASDTQVVLLNSFLLIRMFEMS